MTKDYKGKYTRPGNYKPCTYPGLIKWVVEIRLDCNWTVGVCVRKRFPEERFPF